MCIPVDAKNTGKKAILDQARKCLFAHFYFSTVAVPTSCEW